MILMAILFLWIIWPSNVEIEGQHYQGVKYRRIPGKTYSHARKRKRDSTGRYRYFDE